MQGAEDHLLPSCPGSTSFSAFLSRSPPSSLSPPSWFCGMLFWVSAPRLLLSCTNEHPFPTQSPPDSSFSAHHVLMLIYFGCEHCPRTSVLESLEPQRLSRVAVMGTEKGPLHQGVAWCSQPPGLGPRLETCCCPWRAVLRPPRPVCKSRE